MFQHKEFFLPAVKTGSENYSALFFPPFFDVQYTDGAGVRAAEVN